MPPRKVHDDVVKAELPEKKEENEEESIDATGSNTRVRKRRLDVNPNLIISDGRSKRRKSPTPETAANGADEDGVYDPKDPDRAQSLGYILYGKIMAKADTDGENMAEPFIELPNKNAFPDYYEAIKIPMSLNIVKAKLDKKEYETLRGVERDLGQIFNNAKRYNVKESTIFQYAKKLHKLVRTFYAEQSQPGRAAAPDSDDEDHKTAGRHTQPPSSSIPPAQLPVQAESSHDGEEERRASSADVEASGRYKKRGSYMKEGPTVYKLVKPILKTIKEARAKDGSGREIAGIFSELPDRKDFADYYKTIQHPISLKEIEDRMLARLYNTWQEFFDDVNLMVKNAQTYNEDDSEVYQDAAQIAEILEAHRAAIQDRLSRPPVDKFKVRPSMGTPSMQGVYGRGGMPAQSPAGYAQSPTPVTATLTNYPGMPSTPSASGSYNPTASNEASFLPALPKGVVTADIVASLERYPQYEQAAWVSSLPPVGMQVYRQYLASNEAKKRAGINPTISLAWQNVPTTALPASMSQPNQILADLPSSARANGASNLPDRLAPPLPTIKYLDFSFSSAGNADRNSAIRLHNMRGVVTHAVVLGSDTSELELTAYIADPPAPETPAAGATAETGDAIPEVSLRVNGNVGSLPKYVHLKEGDDTAVGSAVVVSDTLTPGKRPAGMRWTVSVPPSRAEIKIEVVATKPGSLTETSAIFVTRQY